MFRFKLFMIAALSCVLIVRVASAAPEAATTSAQTTCSALVERALTAVGSNCGEMGRNTACYGYNRVNASFAQTMPSNFFSTPSDITDLISLQALTTAPLDEVNDTWGVAVIKAQANLPTTLPGQAVTFLLLGDALVENAVPSGGAFVPAAVLPVTAAQSADLHSGANLNTNIVGSVSAGAALNADAISADRAWVRAADSATGGWLPTTALQPIDLAPLSVLSDAQYAPMQAFYFQTGLDALSCIDAPNTVVVQGPQNFEIAINVNGASVNINSTVQLISMREAPERILNNLPLPPRVLSQLRDHYNQPEDGEVCRIQHLRVISGHARLNDNTILPAGNAAWSAYCLSEPSQSQFAPSAPADAGNDSSSSAAAVISVAPPTREQIVSFISEWGAFRPVNAEELGAIAVLERLPSNLLSYDIELPTLESIQPPVIGGA
ncbi:MAG: hypothetical protein SGI73_02460 [Chloroflexota bacterium]|nr:hypothetical protein [Chloroflexota bacterium]